MITLEDLSRATDGPRVDIPDFVPDPAEPDGFRPYQFASLSYARRAGGRIMLADGMGVGKTLQALAIVSVFRAFPALITAPAFGRLTWAKAIDKFFPSWDYQLVDTKTAAIENRKVTIISYALLGAKTPKKKCDCPHPKQYHEPKSGVCLWLDVAGNMICPCAAGTPQVSIYMKWLLALHPRAVIFDESHLIKTKGADRTKAAISISGGADVRLCLTGTPATRPRQLISQLETIGRMEDLGGSWRFLQRHCNPWGWGNKAGCSFCGRLGTDGIMRANGYHADGSFCKVCRGTGAGLGFWDFKGALNLEELNRKLRGTCYVRRLKSDVQADLPEKTIALVPLEIENRAAYRKAEADVISWLAINRSPGAAYRASKAEEMVKLEVLKQITVDGKMSQVIAWIENFLASGEKLVVFTIHRKTAQVIGDHFKCPVIIGGGDMDKREDLKDQFQADPNMKLIVLNIQAGGTVIELYAASDVAFVEPSWEWWEHDQAIDRVHRKGQKNKVTAWFLIASDTIEQVIFDQVLPAKAATSSGFTDGHAADTAKDAVLSFFARSSKQAV